jgi:hypothetical protein
MIEYLRSRMKWDTPYAYEGDRKCEGYSRCGKPGYAIYRHHLGGQTWGRTVVRCQEHHDKWVQKTGGQQTLETYERTKKEEEE